MELTPYDIERLRSARRVSIRQREDTAALTCIGTVNPKGLLSRIGAAFRDSEHEIPVQVEHVNPARGRRWGRRWGRGLQVDLDDAFLDPTWKAATHYVAPGSRLGLQWPSDRLTGRAQGGVVQMTVRPPYGPPQPFVLVGTEYARSEAKSRSRRKRPRWRLLRAALSVVALWYLAANSVALAAVTATVFAIAFVLSRGSRARTKEGGGPRLWRVSALAGLLSTLLPGVPFLVVLLLASVAVRLLWRHRLTIRRLFRWMRRGGGSDDEGPGSSFGGGGVPTGPYLPSLPVWSGNGTADPELWALGDRARMHVKRVAAMFDALATGWPYRVRTEAIDPSDPSDHIVTAAFGDFDAGLERLVALAIDEGHPERVPCIRAALENEPCAHLPGTRDESHCWVLTRYWLDEIRQRREIPQPAA